MGLFTFNDGEHQRKSNVAIAIVIAIAVCERSLTQSEVRVHELTLSKPEFESRCLPCIGMSGRPVCYNYMIIQCIPLLVQKAGVAQVAPQNGPWSKNKTRKTETTFIPDRKLVPQRLAPL